MMQRRRQPNILITGTPGVGKSLLSTMLEERTEFEYINVNKLAKENDCLKEYDEVYQCRVLDEAKVRDLISGVIWDGGKIVDYHSAEVFPEPWFDYVFVLRTDNTILYDRLKERGYSGRKLEDNIDCEIFQTVLDEAMGYYKHGKVHELRSDTYDQLSENVDKICQCIEEWKRIQMV